MVFFLQYDNARSHLANMTRATIDGIESEMLHHSSYSTELAHYIFSYLFIAVEVFSRYIVHNYVEFKA